VKHRLTEIEENYTQVCTIETDLSYLPLSLQSKPLGEGIFYCLEYDFVPLFGLTELQAVVAWNWKKNVGPLLVWTALRLILCNCCHARFRFDFAGALP